MTTVLKTSRLHLRRLSTADAEFILELLNEPAFIQNIGDRGVRTRDEACAYISGKLVASYEAYQYGLYLVESGRGEGPLGICGFVKRDVLDHPDIGFAFLQRFWSRGFAYESAVAVLDYGRTVLGFDRVFGLTAPGNQSSIRLLERIGLHFERMIRLPGAEAESKLFATAAAGVPSQALTANPAQPRC